MNILAIDTTGKRLSVCLKSNDEWKVVFNKDCNLNHSVVINSQIDNLVKEAGLSYNDIDVYACNIGVGSFTGIRVGIATIKGFNLACPKKLIEVNTFEILAYNTQERVTVLVPDNRGFYCQTFVDGVAVDRPDHVCEKPDCQNVIVFDGEKDYTSNLVGVVENKIAKGEYTDCLNPLYVRKSQAEEGK